MKLQELAETNVLKREIFLKIEFKPNINRTKMQDFDILFKTSAYLLQILFGYFDLKLIKKSIMET